MNTQLDKKNLHDGEKLANEISPYLKEKFINKDMSVMAVAMLSVLSSVIKLNCPEVTSENFGLIAMEMFVRSEGIIHDKRH